MEELSLPQALSRWVEEQPDKTLWTFLDDAGNVVQSLTYQEVDSQTAVLGTVLLEKHELKAGDRVVLVYPPGLAFIIAFVACLRIGVVAVPVYPPDPRSKLRKDILAFTHTVHSCGASVALTSSAYGYAKKVAGLVNILKGEGIKSAWPADLIWVETDHVSSRSVRGARNSKSSAAVSDVSTGSLDSSSQQSHLAFLQYTSGSTSDPKGVRISHGNLAHNLTVIVQELQAGTDTVVVSWLPQYHDMGLIGSYLGALYCGGSGYYMSPFSFIRSPQIWLIAISRWRGTHMQSPNFGYALAARKWKAQKIMPDIDLSCVHHMINGAEPVDVQAISEFYDVFTSHGLPPGVIYPTYGLAEHTVFVCSGGHQQLRADRIQLSEHKHVVCLPHASTGDRKSDDSVVLVGCGTAHKVHGIDVKIVDPESALEVADDNIGEVWIRSKSKAHGYWGLFGKSVKVFCAELGDPASCMDEEEPVDEDPDHDWSMGYLRTGDEGFIHHEELFICGRMKDLIIISGRNHYPQDIERSAEKAHSSEIRPGCSAAFSIEGEGGEDLVLICEVRDGRDKLSMEEMRSLCSSIASSVREEQGVPVGEVLLLKARSNRKTTSGKIARQWCRRSYIAGELSPLCCFAMRHGDEVEGRLGASDFPEPMVDVDLGDAHVDLEEMSVAEIVDDLTSVVLKMSGGEIELQPGSRIADAGLDSLSMAQFSGMLQERYGALISLEQLYDESMTLEGLAEQVKQGRVEGARPGSQVMDRDRPGRCESFITNSCPCCYCLLNCCS